MIEFSNERRISVLMIKFQCETRDDLYGSFAITGIIPSNDVHRLEYKTVGDVCDVHQIQRSRLVAHVKHKEAQRRSSTQEIIT